MASLTCEREVLSLEEVILWQILKHEGNIRVEKKKKAITKGSLAFWRRKKKSVGKSVTPCNDQCLSSPAIWLSTMKTSNTGYFPDDL